MTAERDADGTGKSGQTHYPSVSKSIWYFNCAGRASPLFLVEERRARELKIALLMNGILIRNSIYQEDHFEGHGQS